MKVYYPYLPLLGIVIIGLVFTSYWQPRSRSAVLPYATSMGISELLQQTNVDRANDGKTALGLNAQLNQAAQAKADDMVARNYWSHNTPDGQAPWVFINNAGYKYQKAGENLAYGFMTSDDTIAGWMNSPAHRENLLDGSYQEVGFGFANSSDYQSSGPETIVVAMYGEPVAVAAAPPAAPPPAPAVAKAATTVKSASTPPPAPAAAVAEAKPATKADSAAKPVDQPVTTAQTPLHEPTPQHISRIAAFTGGAAPWLASIASITAVTGLAVLFIKHGLGLRKFIVKGERFVLHHVPFDLTVFAIVVLCFIATRGAGVIR